MEFKLKQYKPNIEYGDIVKSENNMCMMCFNNSGESFAVNLSTGEIIDYGYYKDANELCEQVNLKFVCKNEELVLSSC